MVEHTIQTKSDLQLINEVNVEDILGYIQKRIAQGSSYIDCILSYAEEYNIDIEVLGEIVRESPVLLSSVHEEAEGLNLVEKVQRLPI